MTVHFIVATPWWIRTNPDIVSTHLTKSNFVQLDILDSNLIFFDSKYRTDLFVECALDKY